MAVAPADVAAGLPLSAGAGFCMLCAYYYLQPLSDALALKVGLAQTPYITVISMVLIAVANPLYAAAVRALPVPRVLPAVYSVLAGVLLAFAACFAVSPDGLALCFAFAVFTGIFSLFLTTTFWARMASLHTKPEAKRVYGIIAAGAQVGQLCASASAHVLYSALHQQITLVSAVLLGATVQLVGMRGARALSSPADDDNGAADVSRSARSSGTARRRSEDGAGGASFESSSKCPCGSGWCERCFGGLRVLMSTPLLRAITAHTLLMTLLVSGIWYERAAAVAAAFESDADRYAFFATLNLIVGALTLFMQLFLFGHLLRVIGFHGAMICEPAIVAIGLLINCYSPGLLSIAMLDGGTPQSLNPTKADRCQMNQGCPHQPAALFAACAHPNGRLWLDVAAVCRRAKGAALRAAQADQGRAVRCSAFRSPVYRKTATRHARLPCWIPHWGIVLCCRARVGSGGAVSSLPAAGGHRFVDAQLLDCGATGRGAPAAGGPWRCELGRCGGRDGGGV